MTSHVVHQDAGKLTCPYCGRVLVQKGTRLVCPKGHGPFEPVTNTTR